MIEQANVRSTAKVEGMLRSALKSLCRALSRAVGRARQRRQLAELDSRLLRDIGRTGYEARAEARKPAWRR